MTDEELQRQYTKVGVVEWDGHRLAFRLPTRVEMREYRRKASSPQELPDRVDQLAQSTIVSFDGCGDILQARTLFNAFLERYPRFTDSEKAQSILGILSGAVEEEAASTLGKGCSILSGTNRSSLTGSVNGSAASSPTTPTLPVQS